MAAGITKQAKRGVTRRWLYKQEALCRTLFPDAIVSRKGERYINVSHADAITRDGYAPAFSICLSWGNMSNGESIGMVLLNGKWRGWGDWNKQLTEAYNKL
jgi:hypothetical protein